MQYKDYYKIMGLERGASQDEIKQAYRKYARKYHPDVSKETNAEDKFKELGEAYEVLKDPKKRAQYDRYGEHWKEQAQGYNPQGGRQQQHYQNQSFNEEDAAGFEDFINSIFRQRSQQHSFYDKGQDIHARLNIDLEDSFNGAEKTLQLQVPAFDNQGNVDYQLKAIKVKIPKGIADKQQIRLKGQGGIGRGGKPGDLYIEITFNPHPWFHLERKDIHLQVPVSPWEAALGASIQVPTLAGNVNLKIPKLSQTGKQMRLKGRGLPGQPPGDQYVTLQIVIPHEDNQQLNGLYEQMAKATHFNPREKFGGGHD